MDLDSQFNNRGIFIKFLIMIHVKNINEFQILRDAIQIIVNSFKTVLYIVLLTFTNSIYLTFQSVLKAITTYPFPSTFLISLYKLAFIFFIYFYIELYILVENFSSCIHIDLKKGIFRPITYPCFNQYFESRAFIRIIIRFLS